MTGENLAAVAISGVPYSADRPYTYRIPEELSGAVCAGKRVTVPFGRGNRRTEGFVLETLRGEILPTHKPIAEVLDAEPLMDGLAIRLAKWMKARYFCTYYDAVKAILPAGVWFRYRTRVRMADGQDAPVAAAQFPEESAEAEILRMLAARGEADGEALRKLGERYEKALRRLAEKDLVRVETTAVQTVRDKSVRMARLALSAEDAMAEVEKKKRSAPVRYAVVELLCAEGELSSAELSYYTGASAATLRAMERAGLITLTRSEVLRVQPYEIIATTSFIRENRDNEWFSDGALITMIRS